MQLTNTGRFRESRSSKCQPRREAEIEQLKDLCRHVYIMVPDEEIEISELPKSYEANPVTEEAIGQVQYETTVSAKEEVKSVREAHNELVGALWEGESMIQGGNDLNMSLVKKSIDVMIGSIQRNPDAFIWRNRIKNSINISTALVPTYNR